MKKILFALAAVVLAAGLMTSCKKEEAKKAESKDEVKTEQKCCEGEKACCKEEKACCEAEKACCGDQKCPVSTVCAIVDECIAAINAAENLEELQAATMALDEFDPGFEFEDLNEHQQEKVQEKLMELQEVLMAKYAQFAE